MSKVEYLEKTAHKNWQFFKLLNESGVFQCRLTELREEWGLPMNCHYSIRNINELENSLLDVHHKFESLYLAARAILYLDVMNSEEGYYPEIDQRLLIKMYLRMRKFVENKGGLASVGMDPFWRSVFQVVDLSRPDSHSSWPLLEIQELMRQEVTPSHVKLFLIVEVGRSSFIDLFYRDLRKILKDFQLGREWLLPMYSYTVTEQILFVPPVNLYFEETGGSLIIEIRPRTRLRDIQAMWSVITNRFGNKKKNYPLRNLKRDLRIRELSQKKKEENAKIVDELGDGDIVPSEIGPTTDEGIATNLNIIDLSAGREDTERGKDIVKQARRRFNDRIQKMGSG